MTPEAYAAGIAAIVAGVVSRATSLFNVFRAPKLGDQEWLAVLNAIFPAVYEARWEAGGIAREFYDTQRELAVPGAPRTPVNLDSYGFQQFVRDMEPARSRFLREGATDYDFGQVLYRIARTVENGGRRTIIGAVEQPDPYLDSLLETKEVQIVDERPTETPRNSGSSNVRSFVRGWARVPTGRETCGFCLMLVSRGPVYRSAEAAGLRLGNSDAIKALQGDLDVSEYMDQWHPGCDCKTVPVFKLSDWPGRDDYLRAEQMWKDSTYGHSGKDALNAFRRHVEKLDFSEFGTGLRAA
ncbi:capsid maturation protease [Rhodococcus phage Partridge]|uniref:Capsid maturation protease n=2 Tax=Rhodococcus virus Takoda TaxID=2846062 RepID=A0A6G6XS52_9CAUD|nr:capsid maturation protease [Rhodococcus phage Partridge]QIG61620.1 capsid maturation protease [Rhodococcus phage Dinger]